MSDEKSCIYNSKQHAEFPPPNFTCVLYFNVAGHEGKTKIKLHSPLLSAHCHAVDEKNPEFAFKCIRLAV